MITTTENMNILIKLRVNKQRLRIGKSTHNLWTTSVTFPNAICLRSHSCAFFLTHYFSSSSLCFALMMFMLIYDIHISTCRQHDIAIDEIDREKDTRKATKHIGIVGGGRSCRARPWGAAKAWGNAQCIRMDENLSLFDTACSSGLSGRRDDQPHYHYYQQWK